MARARPRSDRSRRAEAPNPLIPGRERVSGRDNRWQRFSDTYRGHPALEHDAIYAMPRGLIEAICKEPGLQDFFTQDDLAFECDLTATFGGFFLGKPFVSRPWSDQFFQGIAEYNRSLRDGANRRPSITPSTATRSERARQNRNAHLNRATHRAEAEERWGYAGWLVTDTTFRAERDAFRRTWLTEVRQFGDMPFRIPARHGQRRSLRENYQPLYTAYINFLNRWGLDSMQTWDIAVPLRSVLAGLGRSVDPDLVGAGYAFFVPAYQLRRQQADLQLLAQYMLDQGVPEHLRGWLTERDARWGPDQYARLLNVYLCLQLALRARYPEQLRGNLERMDNAIGAYLAGEHASERKKLAAAASVKKARLKMDRRLQIQ